jgi:hypothetical protein
MTVTAQIFERRAPSVYNTIKYKLAKAILDEWFRPHYLLPEDCKLCPLQLATGDESLLLKFDILRLHVIDVFSVIYWLLKTVHGSSSHLAAAVNIFNCRKILAFCFRQAKQGKLCITHGKN